MECRYQHFIVQAIPCISNKVNSQKSPLFFLCDFNYANHRIGKENWILDSWSQGVKIFSKTNLWQKKVGFKRNTANQYFYKMWLKLIDFELCFINVCDGCVYDHGFQSL